MLSWAETKPIIRQVFGPHLLALGFQNPGVIMWRYRPEFVDIVQCDYHLSGFSVELGCQPHITSKAQPQTCECMFRTRLQDATGEQIPYTRMGHIFNMGGTCEEQAQILEEISPFLVLGVNRWFAHFSTVSSAIEALNNNQERGVDRVFDGTAGSPAYNQAFTMLKARQLNM